MALPPRRFRPGRRHPTARPATLESGPIPDSPAVGLLKTSAPQDAIGVREIVGYAVVFGACAALLAPAPQKVGGAEYQVGTHQVAYASENSTFVRGTDPQLFPAPPSVVITVPKHSAAPQPIDEASARLSKYVYPGVAGATKQPKTWLAAPEQLESGSAQLSRYAYPYLFGTDTIGVAQYEIGTHQANYANENRSWIHGTLPPLVPTATADDLAVYRFFEVEQENTEQPGSRVYGFVSAAPAVQVPIRSILVRAPEQISSGDASVWGLQPPSFDRPLAASLIRAPEQLSTGDAFVWGPQPDGIDKPPPATLRAAPEQIESGYSYRARFVYSFVAGTDVAQPHTFVSAPDQIDQVATGQGFLARYVFAGPPVVLTAPEQPAGKRTRHIYRVTIDGQVFEFKTYAAAINFLQLAKKKAIELAQAVMREATELQKASAVPVPVPNLTPPVITISSRALRGAATEAKREIAETYRKAAVDIEIALLLELDRRQKDEEDATLWLLL